MPDRYAVSADLAGQVANGIDAASASRALGGEDDGHAQLWPAWRVSCLAPCALRLWPGVRRAGLPRQSPPLTAGPAPLAEPP
jgi:hypothetical protein